MFGMSLIDRFKSLDVYRKLPSDFVQPTYSGALCKIYKTYIKKNSINNKFNYHDSLIYK